MDHLNPFAAVDHASIPEEFRNGHWAVSTLALKENGKPDKAPRSPVSGRILNVAMMNGGTDVQGSVYEAWATFDQCLEAVASCRFPAMGRLLRREDGFTVIDLDDPDKATDPVAARAEQASLESKLVGAYCETSTSGKGRHYILRASFDAGGARGSASQIEVYCDERYIITTGVGGGAILTAGAGFLNAIVAAMRSSSNPPADLGDLKGARLSVEEAVALGGVRLDRYLAGYPIHVDRSVYDCKPLGILATYEVAPDVAVEIFMQSPLASPERFAQKERSETKFRECVHNSYIKLLGKQQAKRIRRERLHAAMIHPGVDHLVAKKEYAQMLDEGLSQEEVGEAWVAALVESESLRVGSKTIKELIAMHSADPGASGDWGAPLSLWGTGSLPAAPSPGMMPAPVLNFADALGRLRGLDIGAQAMAALAALAGALPDTIGIKMNPHDTWVERAKLWVMLIGNPSQKKTPAINAALAPLTEEHERNMVEHRRLLKLAKSEKVDKASLDAIPPPEQLTLNDTTVEALADICSGNPDGALLVAQDAAGWFGSFGAYSNGKGSDKDRMNWLQAYDGGSWTINRRTRGGALYLDNFSCGILGGIQPDKVRELQDDGDDGLFARLIPIMMSAPTEGESFDASAPRAIYHELVASFLRVRRAKDAEGRAAYKYEHPFSKEAQEVYQTFAARSAKLGVSMEGVSGQLASHILKRNAVFGRLCVLFHYIEAIHYRPHESAPREISEYTARMVEALMDGYMLPHAVSFYLDLFNGMREGSALKEVAELILSRKLEVVTHREITGNHGVRATKNLTKQQSETVFNLLETFDWVRPGEQKRHDSKPWLVNPQVHELFAERAVKLAAEKAEVRSIMKSLGRA